jgi:WD40 repeat protein
MIKRGNPALTRLFFLVLAAEIMCSCGGPERVLKNGASISSLAFSPDGLLIASGGTDGRVRIWQTPTGKPICDLLPSPGTIKGIAFSPEGSRLGVAQEDELRVWDVASGKLDDNKSLESLAGFFKTSSRPMNVALAPDVIEGRFLNGPWALILAWRASGFTAAISPNGRTIACTGREAGSGFIEITDIRDRKLIGRYPLYSRTGLRLHAENAEPRPAFFALIPDGRLLIYDKRESKAGEKITDKGRPPDSVLTLWDPATGREVWRLPFWTTALPHGWIGFPGKFPQTADGRRVVVSLGKNVGRRSKLAAITRRFGLFIRGQAYVEETTDVVVYDALSGKKERTLGSHPWKDASLAVAPDGSLAATGGEDGRIRLWKLH